jgi:hypothetical protein
MVRSIGCFPARIGHPANAQIPHAPDALAPGTAYTICNWCARRKLSLGAMLKARRLG